MTERSLSMLVLSPVLRERRLALAISGMALLQFILAAFGISGWQCPILHVFGIPCPGCGLTRASLFLFHGDWHQAMVFHAFAPLFVIGLALTTIAAVAPGSSRARIIAGTESLERNTRITSLLLVGLIIYWLARLLIFRSVFVQLMQG
jgi:hypothetical protein